MKKLFVFAALLLMLGTSCTKDSSIAIKAEQRRTLSNKIDALLYNYSGYTQKISNPNYVAGHIVVFGMNYQTAESADKITDGLAYLKHAVPGDTSNAYQFPYCRVVQNVGYLDAYGDSIVQLPANIEAFKTCIKKSSISG